MQAIEHRALELVCPCDGALEFVVRRATNLTMPQPTNNSIQCTDVCKISTTESKHEGKKRAARLTKCRVPLTAL
jgi:hypothetical protein